MSRGLFWACLPVIVLQGLWVRRRAIRFAGAAGPSDGSVGRGEPPLRLALVGDSIVAGVGAATLREALAGRLAASLAELLAREVRWEAHGRVGVGVDGIRRDLAPRVAGTETELVILSVGVNDATALRRSSVWRNALGRLLNDVRVRAPRSLIVMLGLPPMSGFPLLPQPLRALFGLRARRFNEVARAEVECRPDCLFVPTEFEPAPQKFSPDGYHPSADSYAEWGRALAERIVPHLDAARMSAKRGA